MPIGFSFDTTKVGYVGDTCWFFQNTYILDPLGGHMFLISWTFGTYFIKCLILEFQKGCMMLGYEEGRTMLELTNVTIGYRSKVVLTDISTSFKPGVVYGLMAPNGYGALFKTIAGDLKLLQSGAENGYWIIDSALSTSNIFAPVFLFIRR